MQDNKLGTYMKTCPCVCICECLPLLSPTLSMIPYLATESFGLKGCEILS